MAVYLKVLGNTKDLHKHTECLNTFKKNILEIY